MNKVIDKGFRSCRFVSTIVKHPVFLSSIANLKCTPSDRQMHPRLGTTGLYDSSSFELIVQTTAW